MDQIILPENVIWILETLESRGHEAWLVGGPVRDMVMGKIPHDYDITTSALPGDVEELFKAEGCAVAETGLKHGTVTVVKDHIPYEITTYRCDGEYSDNRHPDSVLFTRDIKEDLARRDITINAMAWSPARGLLDLFGGQEDIEKGLIRAVGDPARRFSEDALRIMRVLRFSSVLGFKIDGPTALCLHSQKELLKNIASERIFSEFKQLLCGNSVMAVLDEFPDVPGVFIPEILPMVGFDQRNKHHIYDVWQHTIRVIDGVPPKDYLRLAALFHDMGKPPAFAIGEDGQGHFHGHPKISCQIAGEALSYFNSDNDTRHKVLELVKHHDTPVPTDKKGVKRFLNRMGEDLFFDLVALARADNLAQSPEYRDRQHNLDISQQLAHEIIAEGQAFSLKDLAVNGRDLIDAGITPGPRLGSILNELLEKVIDEELPNEKEILLKEAVKHAL